MHDIEQDIERFKSIVEGKSRDELRKHLKSGKQVIKTKKGELKIPLNDLETPRFKFKNGDDEDQGVGQGTGEEGGEQGDAQEGQGNGEAGDNEGNKELEHEFSPEEIAKFLKEELELPDIDMKGKEFLEKVRLRYKTLGDKGPDSLKNFKNTYKNALKRLISTGEYDPKNPVVIPRKEDFKFRNSVEEREPMASAVVIYMMDVSGSMQDEQKETVRTQAFYMNAFLKNQYKDLNVRYIIHDSTAKEVSEEDFFRTKESGGTIISSGYKLIKKIIEEEKITENIYIFQFSDGDNWGGDDTSVCIELLENYFLPIVNLFGYAQVDSRYGSGLYFKDLKNKFDKQKDVVLSRLKSKEDIYDSIKDFLGTGR